MRNHLSALFLSALLLGCQQQSAMRGTASLRFVDGTTQEVPYVIQDGYAITAGDIQVGTAEEVALQNQAESEGKTALTNRSILGFGGRWPGKRVIYDIDPKLPNPTRVREAIRHWQQKTSLRFVQRTDELNYIYVTTGKENCSSALGKTLGAQKILLSARCGKGEVIHEIGHAVGLLHEQSRADRDDYINIHYENMNWADRPQFWKGGWFSQDRGAFDFNSIMMYGAYYFSHNGKPTITRKDGRTDFAQRNGLSPTDIAAIEDLYR